MMRQLLLGLCIALATAMEWAAANPTVEVGKSTVLVSGAETLTKIQADAGNAVSEADPAASGKFRLVYTAPAKAGSATVSYENAGKAEKAVVDITPVKAADSAAGAASKPPGITTDPNPYAPAAKILFAVFALAVVLESGLATVFNWSVFVRYCDAKGVKTPVSFAVAWMLVVKLDLDISGSLVAVFFPPQPDIGPLGGVLSALVLAGGSSGVNNMLQALNIRSVRTAETVTPKPRPTEAWIAVRLVRRKAAGPVYVMSAVNGGALAVIGTIAGTSYKWAVCRLFLRDPGRFPGSGGFPVKPGDSRSLVLHGLDAKGNALAGGTTWGPHLVEAGAIVDVVLEL